MLFFPSLLTVCLCPAQHSNGVLEYCSRLINEKLQCGQNVKADLSPHEILKKSSRGIRQWIAVQVLGHVVELIQQVDLDTVRGYNKPAAQAQAPAAPSPSMPAPSPFGE